MQSDQLKGKSVLVVEDDYLIADTLCFALEVEGASVIGPFPSVSKAMDAIDKGESIDAALLDVNLNGERVYPLADRLIIEKVPIILTTGYDSYIIPQNYAHLRTLQKPVSLHELLGSLGSLLTN